jgi:hypothetical protein
MRNRKHNIPNKHKYIQGIEPYLEKIRRWEEVINIVPARIKSTKETINKFHVQYRVNNGFKCFYKGRGEIQEIFVTSSNLDETERKLKSL